MSIGGTAGHRMIREPILIWGAGAIGGTVGAALARAGCDITLVDVDPEHVSAMARNDLKVTGPVMSFAVPVSATLPDQVAGTYRWIFLSVKAHHTEAATAALLPHLAVDGAVVSLQNGLCEATIANRAGSGRTIGALVNFGADRVAPGEILFGNRGTVAVGELDGRNGQRVEVLRASLAALEPRTRVTDNIRGHLWGKIGYGILLKASALSGRTIADFLDDRGLRPLLVTMVREILRIAEAEGVHSVGFDGFDPSSMAGDDETAIDRSFAQMVAFNATSGKSRTGIWRDLAILHRQTESAAQLAPVQVAAAGHGLAMPLVGRLLALIAEVEQGEAVPGPDLIRCLSRPEHSPNRSAALR